MKKLCFLFVLLLVATSVWAQNTINVSPGQSIQAAIASAQQGDLILVAPGHYEEGPVVSTGGTSGLLFGEAYGIAKNLTVRSTSGAAQTVIDVTGCSDAVVILANSGTVTIDGFTFVGFDSRGIRNGRTSGSGTQLIILNNRVINASGALLANGNGIQAAGNNSIIRNNFVEGMVLNNANWGGTGILVYNGSNCLVEDNITQGSDIGLGLGAYMDDYAGATADNNIFQNNIVRYNVTGSEIEYNSHNNLFKKNNCLNNTYGISEVHDTRNPITFPDTKGVPVNTVFEMNNFVNCDFSGDVRLSTNYGTNHPPIPADHKVRTLCNWWGDYTGPFNATLNPTGTAPELVTNFWSLEGWSTEEWTATTGNCNQPLFWETENTPYSVMLNWNKTLCGFPTAQSFTAHIRQVGTLAWRQAKSTDTFRKVFDLTPNTKYEVRVLFYANANFTAYLGWKGMFTFTTKNPSLTKSQDMSTAFLLSWQPINTADAYIAQIKAATAVVWQHGPLVTNTNTRFFNRIPSEDYAVRVLGFKNGVYIGVTTEANVVAVPVAFQVTNNSGTSATIGWPNLGGSRYILHYRPQGVPGPWIQANTTTNTRNISYLTPGTVYQYRLLGYFMVDGVEEYGGTTPTFTFTAGGKSATVSTPTTTTVNVYPNPFVDELNIEVDVESAQTYTYSIVDVTGKIVKVGQEEVVAGYNTVSINVSELSGGVYIFNAELNGENQSFTITK